VSPARGKGRRRRTHPLAVALILIAAAAFVTFYAFNRGLPFGSSFTAYAVVSNSVNVRPGDPVRENGIDVGQVTGVSPQGNGARIAFSLSSQAFPVHRDATIEIRDRLFLEGSYYLQLNPGTPRAPRLKDGGTIPLSRTVSPVQLYKVLSVFDSAARGDLSSSVEALAKGLGAAPGHASASGVAGLKRAAPHLAGVFSDTAVISRALRGTSPNDLHRLLAEGASVTQTLANSSAQLSGLVHGLYRTSSALASADGKLAQTLSGLDRTLAAIPPALSAVDRSLPSVDRLARTLTPSLTAAPPLISRLTPVVQQLAGVLAPGSRGPLLAALTTTFQEFPSILTQLAGAFPVGKQITDCLSTHVVPILVSHVPDENLSTGRPVVQDFLHFLGNLAGATGNFDGNGPYTRFLAAAGPNTLSGIVLGKHVASTLPPGTKSLQGARPHWIGDLTARDFRPDVPCTSNPIPSLAATTVPPDLTASPPTHLAPARGRTSPPRPGGAPAVGGVGAPAITGPSTPAAHGSAPASGGGGSPSSRGSGAPSHPRPRGPLPVLRLPPLLGGHL
jgi:phospholipid/cholesterol/gamma-HCH transport system substrate-binding protein